MRHRPLLARTRGLPTRRPPRMRVGRVAPRPAVRRLLPRTRRWR